MTNVRSFNPNMIPIETNLSYSRITCNLNPHFQRYVLSAKKTERHKKNEQISEEY